MQPLPPAGSPYFSENLGVMKTAAKPSVGQQDRVEFARPQAEPLIKPGLVKSSPPTLHASPRPSQPPPSPLASLAAPAQSAATAALLPAPLAAALASSSKRHDSWDANPTPGGWRVPKNPSRTPVRPRDPFEVTPGTEDLGALRLVASTRGRIRALRLQWPEEFQEPAFSAQKAVFHDLLTRLPPDVVMHVVAEGLAVQALPGLLVGLPAPERVHIHGLHVRSTPEQVYSPMTMWARDGALLLRTAEGTPVLLLPRSFRGDGEVDPQLNRLQIQGTGAAPARLGQVLPNLLVRRSHLTFEGGDVVGSDTAVLVGGHTVARNMADLKLSRDAVVEQFAALFGLPVLVVEPQPEFHVDLGFTFLDEQTVAVADPGQGMLLAATVPELEPLVRVTREKQLSLRYDHAAAWLQRLGYQVVRLPALAGLGLLTPYYTYNNVLIENFPGTRRVYMPTYGVEALDSCAREVYRQHGFQVVDMPSARHSTRLWGAIRCATGELEVSES